MNPLAEITFKPIGIIHSQHAQATGTPIQPVRVGGSPGYAVPDKPVVANARFERDELHLACRC